MSLRILVVDDNQGEVRFLRSFFTRHPDFIGYALKVLEAADGEQGLDVFVAERPDIVLVDLLLPKIDGMTLCGEIRSRQGEGAVGLLAISSVYRDADTAAQLREQFDVQLLTKPLDLQSLSAAVLALMGHRQQSDSGATHRWTTPTLAGAPVVAPTPDAIEMTVEPNASAAAEPVPAAAPPVVALADAPGAAEVRAATSSFDFSFQSQGSLEEGLVARLLVGAADARATGTLQLSRGRVRKVIYLDQGQPTFVDSNVRNETLGAYLLGQQKITEEQFGQAIALARSEGSKFGQALVSLGILDGPTLEFSLRAQVELKLVTALRWFYGAYDFVPDDARLAQVPRFPVDGVPLVLGAMHRLCSTVDLAARLGPVLDLVPRWSDVGQRQLAKIHETFGSRLLQLLETGLSLRQVIDASGDGAVVMSCVAALQDVGLLAFCTGERPHGAERRDASSPAPSHDSRQPTPSSVQASVGVELRHLDPTRQSTTDEGIASAVETSHACSGSADGLATEAPGVTPGAPAATSGAPGEKISGSDESGVAPAAPALEVPAPAGESDNDRPPQLPLAEVLATRATQEPVGQDTFGAEVFFQQGRSALQSGRVTDAVDALRQAVEMNPEQPDYQASLGWAMFLARGRGEAGAMAARSLFEVALALSPDSAQIHELASRVEEDAHGYTRAAEHLTLALKFGPARMDLFERLKQLLFRLADYGELERLYRNMVFRLRDRDPQATASLWLDLARLYGDKLVQPDNAQLALRVAEKLLSADDPRVVELRALVSAREASGGAREVLEARTLACQRPGDLEALRRLFTLSQRARQFPSVLTAGAALAARGSATPEDLAVIEGLRCRQLPVRDPSHAGELLPRLRHGSDRPSMERLMAELSPLLCDAHEIPLDALGSGDDFLFESEQLPDTLSAALAHATAALQMVAPPLYLSRTISGVVPRPSLVGSLLVHESLMSETDERTLAFLMGRALSCLGPGRRHVFARSANDLKTAILAALTACQPEVPLAGTDDGVAAFSQRIAADEALLERIGPLVSEVLSEASRLNLTEWIRGVAHTSARVGLWVCGDIFSALAQVRADTPTAEDLTAYALSDAGAALLKPRG